MDYDLDQMTRDELVAEVKRLRHGIRTHRDSTGHALCWHHPQLWALLPEKTDPMPVVPDWPQFLEGCVRYRQSLDEQIPRAPRSNERYEGYTAVTQRYRRWLEYERDAHAKVLASLDSVPADRRDAREYRRAVSLLAHIVAARRVWLFRLGVAPEPPKEFFPENVSLEQVSAELQAAEAHWTAYLARCDDAELAREFEYQSLDSGRFRNRIEDILAQLFGHSWYHRGQIAMLVRAAGGQPAITDLIYWCREPVVAGPPPS